MVSVMTIACKAEFQVNTSTYKDQEFPAVAIDANNNFVVVWRSEHAGIFNKSIMGQRFSSDGSKIGSEFQLSTSQVGGRINHGPVIGMDSSGNFVVVWPGYRNDEEHIIARRYDTNGLALSGEFVVSTNKYAQYDNGHLGCSISMTPSGDFVIVWEAWHGDDDHNGHWGIYGRCYNAAGVAITDEFKITQIFHGKDPDVAMDGSGDFVVVWRREGSTGYPPSGTYVAMRRYNSDGTPKTGELWVTESFNWSNSSTISMNSSGNYIISYDWGNWQDPNVYAQLYDPNGTLHSEAFMVNADPNSSHGSPASAMLNNGEFLIAWNSPAVWNDGDIMLRRFDKDANSVGEQTVFNTYLQSVQRYPDIAVNSSGNYVIAWQSDELDGDDYGIFCDIGPKVCCADFDDNLYVNLRDFAYLAEEWLDQDVELLADLVDDNIVDELDLGALSEQWLEPCYKCGKADVHVDGQINFKDYAILVNNLSKFAPKGGDITGDLMVDTNDLRVLLFHWLSDCK